MSFPRPRGLLVAALATAAVATAAAAPPTHAATWTEVANPSTATISNLEWRGAELFWTTGTGRIYRRAADGTITERYSTGGSSLNDIEFQPAGNVGFAVGAGGKVIRTADGGASWAPVNGITASNEGNGSGNKCTIDTPLNTDLNFVRWAGTNRVFVGGSLRQIVAASSATASQVGQSAAVWVDANRKLPAVAGDNCRLEYTGPFVDMAVVSPSSFYIAGEYSYAQYLGNYDDDQSESVEKGFVANSTQPGGRMAIDPENGQRMWSVNGGRPYGVSGAVYTENGWADGNEDIRVPAGYPGDDSPWDVDFAGGTVMMVGSGGKILNSVDGRTFANGPATGAIAAADWHAVSLAGPTQAAIGGVGGKLAISTDANVVPLPVTATTPPTGGGGTTTPPVVTTPPVTKPPTVPSATLPGGSRPPLVGGAAIRTRKAVTLRVKGTLGVPTGVSRSAACKGNRMTVAVYKGKRKLKSKRIKLDSKCRYAGRLRVKRRVVGSATRLKLRVSFKGNPVLRKVATTYAVKVKPA